MKKTIIILISFLVILTGIIFGNIIYYSNINKEYNDTEDERILENKLREEQKSIEISSNEEKTTPNTLLIYKIYYTKCKHYIRKYEQIDINSINLTESEFKEKYKKWKIEKFSSNEIELSTEKEEFCNEHYKIILKDNKIVINILNELGEEKEYEKTNITTEFLTESDILRLTTGIIVYGKESLTSTIEDYE